MKIEIPVNKRKVVTLNVKYLFAYVELCKRSNQLASWEGLKEYYNNNKGVY